MDDYRQYAVTIDPKWLGKVSQSMIIDLLMVDGKFYFYTFEPTLQKGDWIDSFVITDNAEEYGVGYIYPAALKSYKGKLITQRKATVE